MAKQSINLGTAPGGTGGDTARNGFEKCNANFDELYPAAMPANDTEKAAARARFGLGSAATAAVTESGYDSTAGRVLRVGDGGINATLFGLSYGDNPGIKTGFYGFAAAGGNSMPLGAASALMHIDYDASNAFQIGSLAAYSGGYFVIRSKVAGVWEAWKQFFTEANAGALPISVSLSASTDNARSLGTASMRWSVVYAGTGAINTSDARDKTAVRALLASEIAAAQQLASEIGAYKFLAAVEEKGDAAREHAGMTVQRAIEVMQQHGLSPFNYGFICYDEWDAETVEHPAQYERTEQADGTYANGDLISEAWTEVVREAGNRYSFRPDELLLFVARGQAAYLAQLESRIAALEAVA